MGCSEIKRVYVCVCVCVHARACVCVCVRACVRVCVHPAETLAGDNVAIVRLTRSTIVITKCDTMPLRLLLHRVVLLT